MEEQLALLGPEVTDADRLFLDDGLARRTEDRHTFDPRCGADPGVQRHRLAGKLTRTPPPTEASS